jgi:WD40 repeat protein
MSSRWTLSGLIMATTFVAIMSVFTQSEGCGRRFERIECISFSADGSRIAVSKLNGRYVPFYGNYMADVVRTISLLNAENGDAISVIHQAVRNGHVGPGLNLWRQGLTSVLYNPLNDRVIAQEFGGGAILQLPADGGAPRILNSLTHCSINLALSRSGRLVVAMGDEDEFSVLDTVNDTQVLHIKGSESLIASISEDESAVVSVNYSGVYVWDIRTGTLKSIVFQTPVPHRWDPAINGIAFLPDDSVIIGSQDWIRSYNLCGQVVATIAAGKFDSFVLSNDGARIAALRDGNIETYDVATLQRLMRIRSDAGTCLAYSPNNMHVAVGGLDGTVALVDTSAGKRKWISRPPSRRLWPWPIPRIALLIWLTISFYFVASSKKTLFRYRRPAQLALLLFCLRQIS